MELSLAQLAQVGVSTAASERALQPHTDLAAAASAARGGEAGMQAAFLRSWIEMDERGHALVQGLNRPVLALAGDYDWNVPAEDLEAWATTFASAPNNPGHHEVAAANIRATACNNATVGLRCNAAADAAVVLSNTAVGINARNRTTAVSAFLCAPSN